MERWFAFEEIGEQRHIGDRFTLISKFTPVLFSRETDLVEEDMAIYLDNSGLCMGKKKR